MQLTTILCIIWWMPNVRFIFFFFFNFVKAMVKYNDVTRNYDVLWWLTNWKKSRTKFLAYITIMYEGIGVSLEV